MSSAISYNIAPLARSEGLRSVVAQRLLEAIFSGRLKAGDRLIVMKIAQQMGVSATPIREALVELASIGLIEVLPNRGAVCRPFGPRELREIYQIRRILEAEATRTACGNLPKETLRDLRISMARLAERKGADWSIHARRLDAALHDLIIVSCGNNRLHHEIERYNDLMDAIRHVVEDQRNVQLRAVEQHIEIIDALLENNADEAGRRMAEHIDTTARGVEAVMFDGESGELRSRDALSREGEIGGPMT